MRHTAAGPRQGLLAEPGCLVVVFGEVHGGTTTAGAKNHTTAGLVGFRVLDIARVPIGLLDGDRATIAARRDGDTHARLAGVQSSSHAVLDETGEAVPEGVVVRSADRSRIARIRFEDYERAAKAARRA